MTKHLYIHIPFCNQICKFCDFKRIKSNEYQIMNEYVNKIINQVKLSSSYKQYKTIYLGGGTPNHLADNLLNNLLYSLKDYLEEEYEFTIECNPDLINQKQIDIFVKNKINRISLGVQSTNNEILKAMNRTHNIEDVQQAIELLQKNNLTNISCDFIYDLPNTTLIDIDNYINFIVQNKINHVSFYALELKENSILTKSNYQLDDIENENKMFYLQKQLKKYKYHRYEVSNWSKDEKYQSQHNLAYWKTNDWKAIGYGSCGFEHNNYYEIGNKINNFYVTKLEKYSEQKKAFQIIMMGLRLKQGIDLNIKQNLDAYNLFKNKLTNCNVIDNHLVADNIDLIDDILINLI